MKKIPAFVFGIPGPRAIAAVVLCSVGSCLAMLSFAGSMSVHGTGPAPANWIKLVSYTPPTIRQGVNANGVISNTDVSTTKTQVGASLP